ACRHKSQITELRIRTKTSTNAATERTVRRLRTGVGQVYDWEPLHRARHHLATCTRPACRLSRRRMAGTHGYRRRAMVRVWARYFLPTLAVFSKQVLLTRPR
ncbi:hypothetical protein OC861_000961, partial [Tilletia horrida]